MARRSPNNIAILASIGSICEQWGTSRESYKSRSKTFSPRNQLLTTLLYENTLFLLLMFMYMQYCGNFIGIWVCVVQGIPLQRPFEAWCTAVKCCLTCEMHFKIISKIRSKLQRKWYPEINNWPHLSNLIFDKKSTASITTQLHVLLAIKPFLRMHGERDLWSIIQSSDCFAASKTCMKMLHVTLLHSSEESSTRSNKFMEQ